MPQTVKTHSASFKTTRVNSNGTKTVKTTTFTTYKPKKK